MLVAVTFATRKYHIAVKDKYKGHNVGSPRVWVFIAFLTHKEIASMMREVLHISQGAFPYSVFMKEVFHIFEGGSPYS